MANKTSARDKHLQEALNLSRDAVYALSNNDPSNLETVIYILEDAIDEVKEVIKADKR
jgi:predicted GTPase